MSKKELKQEIEKIARQLWKTAEEFWNSMYYQERKKFIDGIYDLPDGVVFDEEVIDVLYWEIKNEWYILDLNIQFDILNAQISVNGYIYWFDNFYEYKHISQDSYHPTKYELYLKDKRKD